MHAVFVGGGFAGLGAGEAMAREGWKVTCVEREPVPGLGCSQASLGLVLPADPGSWPQPLVDLTLRAFEQLKDYLEALMDRSGRAIEVGAQGLIQAAIGDHELDELERTANAYTAMGLSATLLDSDELAVVEPALAGSAGAVLFSGAYCFDPPSLISALEAAIEMGGGTVHTSTHAKSLLVEGARCFGVRLADGREIRADVTVICTGGSTWGLYPALDGVLTTSRGQSLLVRTPKAFLRHAAYIGELDVIPRYDGTTMLGATQEGPGTRIATLQGVTCLIDQFRRYFDVDDEIEFIGANVGLRARTADRLPVIGPSSAIGDLYLCTGLYKNGATLLPILGTTFVRALEAGQWSSLAAFDPGRLHV